MEVIESVPVHEDIKLGKPTRDKLIENYAQTIRNLGKYGVKCICYNFMPVFDWLRTDLRHKNADGQHVALLLPRRAFAAGSQESAPARLGRELYARPAQRTSGRVYVYLLHEQLFDNLVYFLNGIMPACDETGIDMAIHPDDPPWDMFGLPRIIVDENSYEKMFAAVPDKHNGITSARGLWARAGSTICPPWRQSMRVAFTSRTSVS